MDYQPGTEDHRKFYAQLSQAAYDNKHPLPDGYAIDAAYSNRNRILAVNNDKKHAVYSFRGTDLVDARKRPADMGTNVLLALGLQNLSSRFKNGLSAARKVRKDYADYQLDFTGHSMGAGVAAHAHSKIKDTRFVGFSAHTPAREVLSQTTENAISKLLKPKKTDSVHYTTALDPVALSTNLTFDKNKFVVPQTEKNPHSLRNFL